MRADFERQSVLHSFLRYAATHLATLATLATFNDRRFI